MGSPKTFTAANFETLKRTCDQISSLSSENIDGDLMFSQAQILGNKIQEFVDNPIVKTSGCIRDYSKYIKQIKTRIIRFKQQ